MWLKAEVEVAAAEMLRLPERDAAAEAVAVSPSMWSWLHCDHLSVRLQQQFLRFGAVLYVDYFRIVVSC
jgi:hypothetical protein